MPFGEHELEVRAKGPMGAVDLEPAVYSWVSGDVTPPVVTIHSGPAAATTSTEARFTMTVDDPEAALQCSLDGGPLHFCESPKTYTEADLALANGPFLRGAHARGHGDQAAPAGRVAARGVDVESRRRDGA